MCIRSLTLLLCLAGVAFAADEKPYRLIEVRSVPVSPAAREALTAINDAVLVLGPQEASYWKQFTRQQIVQMREDAQQKIRAVAVGFAGAHPQDPLRWVGIHQMLQSRPEFITGFRPGIETAEGMGREFWIVDEAAKTAWTTELTRYESELETAADVPWEVRERRALNLLFAEARSLGRNPAPAALAPLDAKIAALAARFPEGSMALDLFVGIHRETIKAGGAAAEQLWTAHRASPNRAFVERAQAELRKLDTNRQAFDIGFTAVDGRKVDLKQLRGKVVLLDFWATWCGPCIAELPNLKRVYAEYHKRGFEIVGITLENAHLKPTDSPEQAVAKLEKAKKVLMDFTAKEDMPWPQHFDGKHWKNLYAKELAVTAIPAMFLLDQEGRIVSTDARGEKLEQEVKRLLKL